MKQANKIIPMSCFCLPEGYQILTGNESGLFAIGKEMPDLIYNFNLSAWVNKNETS